jgi:hypothetical protein
MDLHKSMVVVFNQMEVASNTSRWAKDRARRGQDKPELVVARPLQNLMYHCKTWADGQCKLFLPTFVQHHGFRGSEFLSRCFMLVLRNFESTERIANKLLLETTRAAIKYRERDGSLQTIPLDYMRDVTLHIFRLPGIDDAITITGPCNAVTSENVPSNEAATKAVPSTVEVSGNKKQKTGDFAPAIATPVVAPTIATPIVAPAMSTPIVAPVIATPIVVPAPVPAKAPYNIKTSTKYTMLVTFPVGCPVSSPRFLAEMAEITPLGCVMAAHFPIMIQKTGWRSCQVIPHDNWGKWKHIGMGKEPLTDPHMLRINIAQASTAGE